MTARAVIGGFSEDLAKAPGPGRYDAIKPDQCVRKAPAYSMLGRNRLPGGMYIISMYNFWGLLKNRMILEILEYNYDQDTVQKRRTR